MHLSSSGHVLNRASPQLDKLRAARTCWTHRLDGERDRVTRNLRKGTSSEEDHRRSRRPPGRSSSSGTGNPGSWSSKLGLAEDRDGKLGLAQVRPTFRTIQDS